MLDENSKESEDDGSSKGLKRKHDECSPGEDLQNDRDQKTGADKETTEDCSEKKLSKKQLRKMRRKEQWLAFRPEKR